MIKLEKMQEEVKIKLAAVNETLLTVEKYRTQLQENAGKAKEDVHKIVERQVVALRGRERQLIRQVEVVTAHQACLLGTQQANLVHMQGALTAQRNILIKCSPDDEATLNKVKVDEISSVRNIRPVNLVSVQLNEATLKEAVVNFALIHLPDTITHHSSPIIPTKLEDYEDDEHDVLHKSVAGGTGPDSPLHVNVNFPRIMKGMDIQNNTILDCNQYRPADVNSWLSNLQHTRAAEVLRDGSLSNFELSSNMGENSVRTSISSSIEVMPRYQEGSFKGDGSILSTSELKDLENKNSYVHIINHSRQDLASHSSSLDSNNQRAYEDGVRRASGFTNSKPILEHMSKIMSSKNTDWLEKRVQAPEDNLPIPVKKVLYTLPTGPWLRSFSSNRVPIKPQVQLAHSNIWLLRKYKSEKEVGHIGENIFASKDMCSSSNQITCENLSQALGKLNFRESSSCTGTPSNMKVNNYYTENSSPSSAMQSWLLSGQLKCNVDPGSQIKIKSHSNLSLNSWLASASDKLVLCADKKYRAKYACSSRSLPPKVLGVANADLNKWLLKRF